MSDIYSAPDSALTEGGPNRGEGSLEKGIAGDYQFAVGEALSEAWALTDGAKWTFNIASSIYFVVYLVVMVVTSLILFGSLKSMGPNGDPSVGAGLSTLQNLIVLAVAMPMSAGIWMMGIRRAVGAPIAAGQVLGYFHKVLPLLATYLLMMLLVVIGFILLIIPGIYLLIAYMLALPLVVEKNLGPWQALEASRKAVSKRWFEILGFGIVIGLINIAGAIPLGIGLIWTMPMTVIATGVLYRNVFGVEARTVNG